MLEGGVLVQNIVPCGVGYGSSDSVNCYCDWCRRDISAWGDSDRIRRNMSAAELDIAERKRSRIWAEQGRSWLLEWTRSSVVDKDNPKGGGILGPRSCGRGVGLRCGGDEELRSYGCGELGTDRSSHVGGGQAGGGGGRPLVGKGNCRIRCYVDRGLGLTSCVGLRSGGGDKCECGNRNGLACGGSDRLGMAESDNLRSGCADGLDSVLPRDSDVEVVVNSDQATATDTDRAIAIGSAAVYSDVVVA